jgi:hypothetical protein
LHLNAQPSVAVRTDSAQLEISWPSAAAGFNLQWTSGLQNSETWDSVTNAPFNSNGVSSVVLPLDSPQRFFRLAR